MFILVTLGLIIGGHLAVEAKKKVSSADDNIVYYCKEDGSVSKVPGKCTDAQKMRVVKLNGTAGYLCPVDENSSGVLEEDEPLMCDNGKPPVKADLNGFYVCNCGNPKCVCTVSMNPGLCKCGNKLKRL